MKKQIWIIFSITLFIAVIIQVTRMEVALTLNNEKNIELLTVESFEKQQLSPFDFSKINKEKCLIIINYEEEGAESIGMQIEQSLKYMKKDFETISAQAFRQVAPETTCVFTVLEDLDTIENVEEIMKYIFEGGNLFVAKRFADTANFRAVYRRLGIKEFGDYGFEYGIRLLDNVLIKCEDIYIPFEYSISNSTIDVQLDLDTELYAETPEGVKLMWKKDYGDGSILYFNGTMLNEKNNRGMIFGGLRKLMDDWIHPFVNAKIMYIDDFPAPIPYGNHPKIDEEFGISIRQFFKEIWWPDMLAQAKMYNLKYTAVFIGSYDDDTVQVGEDYLTVDFTDIAYYGKEVLSDGGELGIHGYNHQPLTLDELYDKTYEYKKWPSIENMDKALISLIDEVKSVFPEYTMTSYVPPSNIISPDGRTSLKKTDLRIIGALYSRGEDLDGYEQEFGLANDNIIEFPRFTYKYAYDDDLKWISYNAATVFGMSSHFVHPDDVLDPYRSGDMLWGELLKGFDELNKDIFKKYPWMEGVISSVGANRVAKYDKVEPRYEWVDESLKIYCNQFIDEMQFIYSTDREVKKTINCSVQKIDKELYLIKVSEPLSEIQFR